MVVQDCWHGLYNNSWQGLIDPASFAHPAKMSLGILRKIFAHAKEEKWLVPKGIVLDPFAGIGTTALESLLNGCAFQGVELEPRFFALMQTNIAQWIHDYRHLPNFGPWAMCVNGDSRRLLEHVPAPASLAVASPPWADLEPSHAQGSSPSSDRLRAEPPTTRGQRFLDATYGTSPGQLANMPTVDMALSSPPYADGCGHTGGRDLHPEHVQGGEVRHVAYGESTGQMADMSVTSPPWENSLAGTAHATAPHDTTHRLQDRYKEPPVGSTYQDVETRKRLPDGTWPRQRPDEFYDNLGITDGNTFWEAARLVVSQTYALLRENGHAIFVCKNYIRNKEIVPFSLQWAAMCQEVGFEWIHHHKAMLVEDHGTELNLFGGETKRETRRESFFRRLARKRTGISIDNEDVLCFVKRSSGGGSINTCVSSPPYSVGLGKEHTYADPAKREKDSQRGILRDKHIADPFYGSSEGNLGNMPEGTATLSVSSPPYADRCANDNQRTLARDGLRQGHNEGDGATYGATEGNLSTLPEDTPKKRFLRPRSPRVAQERVPTPKDMP